MTGARVPALVSYILPSWLPSHYCIPYSFRKQHQDYLSMWFSFQSGAIAPSTDQDNYLLISFQHAEASGLTTAACTTSICIIKTGMPHPTCCWQCTLPHSALWKQECLNALWKQECLTALWKQECLTQLVVGSVQFLQLATLQEEVFRQTGDLVVVQVQVSQVRQLQGPVR